MQNAKQYQPDLSPGLLDDIGGEPLVGSGFEGDDPESGFSIREEALQE